MRIRPIRTDKDHATALRRIETLMDAAPGTAAAGELDVVATLVEAYEDRRFPIDEPDPVEAIRFRMDQMNPRCS
jgi:HTH-type transcriptional regulator/antitoxin HigA